MGLKADVKQAISANLTAAHKNRVIAAFSAAYGYQTQVSDPTFVPSGPTSVAPMIPNPQSAADFTAEKIVGFINEIVVAQETQAAKAAVVTPTVITIT